MTFYCIVTRDLCNLHKSTMKRHCRSRCLSIRGLLSHHQLAIPISGQIPTSGQKAWDVVHQRRVMVKREGQNQPITEMHEQRAHGIFHYLQEPKKHIWWAGMPWQWQESYETRDTRHEHMDTDTDVMGNPMDAPQLLELGRQASLCLLYYICTAI